MTVTTVRNLRRLSQIIFFAVFFWLILKTNFSPDFQTTATTDIMPPYPAAVAFQIDPLTALGTFISSGTFYKGLLWSLVVLIPTIFIGRFFCGWVCPLGTLNHWISEIHLGKLGRRNKSKIESNRYKKYQRIKYYLLLILIAAALVGPLQIGLLDPLSFLARSLGTVVLPAMQKAASGTVGWLESLDYPSLGSAARSAYDFMAPFLLNIRPAHFHATLSIALIFFAVLILNRIYTRFWCRGICPLGALLGFFSRYAILGLKKDVVSCNQCRLCLLHCQGGHNPDLGSRWHQPECHLCLNCQASCPQQALHFGFFPHQEDTATNPSKTTQVDITRRQVLASLVGGLALYPLFRLDNTSPTNTHSRFLRPPGSANENRFLDKCTRCGQCMNVCPNNALHPTLSEAGWEGLWTPVFIPRIGYCEPSCTLCGQICPTGAIQKLTIEEKIGTSPVRIGTAFVDRNRCLTWTEGNACGICEAWCPRTPKAVRMLSKFPTDNSGTLFETKHPYVDPELCIGCGMCEYACPVVGQAAIYVTAVGESRQNRKMMQRRNQNGVREISL